MSEKSPSRSVHSPVIPPDLLATAAQRRAQDAQPTPEAQQMQDYDLRLKFRRLIDPGILRPNPKNVAMGSLKVHILVYIRRHKKFMAIP